MPFLNCPRLLIVWVSLGGMEQAPLRQGKGDGRSSFLCNTNTVSWMSFTKSWAELYAPSKELSIWWVSAKNYVLGRIQVLNYFRCSIQNKASVSRSESCKWIFGTNTGGENPLFGVSLLIVGSGKKLWRGGRLKQLQGGSQGEMWQVARGCLSLCLWQSDSL